MTDALETLARELEEMALSRERGEIPVLSVSELRASAAACRELATIREYFNTLPSEQEKRWELMGRVRGKCEPATDAALAAFMESRQ